MRLRSKLLISYVGIVLLAVTIVLFLVIENAQRELTEKIGHDLQTVSAIEAGNVNEYLRQKIKQIKDVSREYVFHQEDKVAIKDYVNQIKDEDPELNAIAAFSQEGETIAKAGRGRIPVTETLLTQALKAEKDDVTLQYGYTDSEKTMIQALVVVPVSPAKSGTTNMVLAVTVDLSQFMREVVSFEKHMIAGKSAYLLNNSSTMIISQEGSFQRFDPLVYVQENSSLAATRKAVKEGYTVYKETTGEKAIAGFAGLLQHGPGKVSKWSVVSMAPAKEVFSPAIRLRNKMIVLGFIVVFVALIISFIIANGIIRPLLKLVRVTDGIANGALARRADIKLNDEVGDLARSFNKMTDKLNEAIVLRDQEIIERRNAEEELREEITAKTDFITMISREFKTPLVAVEEGIEKVLVEAGDKLDDKQKKILEISQRSGKSLNKLIADIVHFHHLERDAVEFNMQENDINEVVKEVHDIMLPLIAEKKGVELLTKEGEALPKAKFDKEKISLVLTNIVNMAIQATEKGRVTITTEKEGFNALKVSVEDTGASLEKKDLDNIFDSYEKTGLIRDIRAGGTGLGLAITKEIIGKHNGKIWADTGGGKGLLISFILPVTERRKG